MPSLTHAGALQLTWVDNSDNEEGFRIYRRETAIPTYGNFLVTVLANSETYTDTSVALNINYTYRVTAYNSAGESPPSNEASGILALAEVEDMPPIAVSSLEVDPLPTAGLQLHLSFDEGIGTIVSDSSGNGYSGQVSGAQWKVDGKVNGALAFDGINDYVDVGDVAINSSGLSIAVWVQVAGFTNCVNSHDCRIVSRAADTTEQGHDYMLSTVLSGGNTVPRFRLKTGGITTTLIPSSGTLTLDTWHHIAATYNGSMMRLYVDGTEVGSMAKIGMLTMTPGRLLHIGRNPNGYGPWLGWIDDIRIYDRALSQIEIDQLFNQ